jgi:hypothetical protein
MTFIPKGGMNKTEDEKAVDSNDNSLEEQQVEEAPADSPVAPSDDGKEKEMEA